MPKPRKTQGLNEKLSNQSPMKWHNPWTREYGVQYCEVIMTAFGERGPSKASIFENHILYPDNKNMSYHVPENEWTTLLAEINTLVADSHLLEKEIEEFEEYSKGYVRAAERIGGMSVEKLENKELLGLYESFREKWIDATSYLWTMFVVNELVSERIEKLLEAKSKEFSSNEKLDEFVQYVATPNDKASALKLNQELRQLKCNFSEGKLEEIYKKYRWMPCLDIHYSPWNKEDVVELYEHHHLDEPPLNENIIHEASLTQEERSLVELNRKMTYYKDLRDEYRRIGIYNARNLFKEIGRRMGITLKEISFLRASEIRDFLTGGKRPDENAVKERFDGFMMFEEDGKLSCIPSKKAAEYASKIGFSKKEHSEKEVKGKTASKGSAKGRARIILQETDLAKVSKGDILVALTTGPSYVPAMAKAAAFVTDQGGITCHAAIVAREMKKPCIVGTQNATRILKDGELVEVDADAGTVRKM